MFSREQIYLSHPFDNILSNLICISPIEFPYHGIVLGGPRKALVFLLSGAGGTREKADYEM